MQALAEALHGHGARDRGAATGHALAGVLSRLRYATRAAVRTGALMSPQRTHAASIRWSSSQERLGLPDEVRVVDPAWLAGEVPKRDASWSLVCEFAATPRRQGNPSLAQVRYLFPEAPHEQLAPGAKLQLFERGTTGVAHVEIID